jgi:hypothetical protein
LWRADERTRTADLLITSWLAAILVRAIAYRYVPYSSRNLGHSGVARPIAYRPVPIRLQYRLQYVLEYLGCLLYSGLLSVAPYCVPGGVRVVSKRP